MGCAIAILDYDVLCFNVSQVPQTSEKCAQVRIGIGGSKQQHADAPHALRLLRARRERPRRHRAAECDQQFPPSDGDCHTPLPCEVRKWNDTTPRARGLHVQGGQEFLVASTSRQIPVGPSKEPIQRSIVHLLGSAHLRRNPGMNFVMTLGVVLAGFWFDAAMAQEGYFGHDHDKWHHGFYQTLERPDTKSPCCNLTDCRPTSGRQVDGHYEVKVNGAWVSVPSGKILKQSAPDLGFHVCAP